MMRATTQPTTHDMQAEAHPRRVGRIASVCAVTGFALIVAVGGQPGAAGATAPTQRRPDTRREYADPAVTDASLADEVLSLAIDELGS
jgi:hypothetical protein